MSGFSHGHFSQLVPRLGRRQSSTIICWNEEQISNADVDETMKDEGQPSLISVLSSPNSLLPTINPRSYPFQTLDSCPVEDALPIP